MDRWTQARQRGAQRLNREQWRDELADIDPERRLMKGSHGTYISPDDPTVLFQMDRYRVGFGIAWEYFAVRCELPETTKPPF